MQVLHQDETPLLYSLVFGEGVVNDATSVVLFNAIKKLDVSKIEGWRIVLHIFGDFLYLFSTSTVLGVSVSNKYLNLHVILRGRHLVFYLILFILIFSVTWIKLSGVLNCFVYDAIKGLIRPSILGFSTYH